MEGLAGKRVLIVEDEPIIAFLLEDMIDDLGMTVAGRASALEEARELARAPSFDAAIMDINLHGQMSYPAAELLARQGVPLVFVSGYARDGVPPGLANAPWWPSPTSPTRSPPPWPAFWACGSGHVVQPRRQRRRPDRRRQGARRRLRYRDRRA